MYQSSLGVFFLLCISNMALFQAHTKRLSNPFLECAIFKKLPRIKLISQSTTRTSDPLLHSPRTFRFDEPFLHSYSRNEKSRILISHHYFLVRRIRESFQPASPLLNQPQSNPNFFNSRSHCCSFFYKKNLRLSIAPS